MYGTNTKAALVSTNSITQGEQVAIMWKPLFEKGIKINFAYRTFRWDSEASIKAHVHCVIIGFSTDTKQKNTVVEPVENTSKNCHAEPVSLRRLRSAFPKIIYLNDTQKIEAKNINGYLLDAPSVFIENVKSPICNVPEMVFGSMANDGGNFILTEEEAEELKKKEPLSEKFIKLFLGAEEFINNKKRYCLWLLGASPAELRKMPLVMERVEKVRKMRSESKREATNKLAETPMLFGEIRQPKEGSYLLVPRVSSEKRRYIPIGFLDCDTIASDAAQIIPNATIYDFGILTSNVHNAWMRAVCGRLEMRYRYSKDIVYNNFPWPNPGPEQKAKIEQTAQAILDARAKYPGSSLADLYDETVMPADLRAAQRENDKAVMQAYGFKLKMTESEVVAELFKLYEDLVK